MLTGSTYVSKMLPKLYIKPYTTAFTKPVATLTKAADIAAALAAFEGTAMVTQLIIDSAEITLADGDYFIVPSPYNNYLAYIDENGAGASRATCQASAVTAGCSAVLAISVTTAQMAVPASVTAALVAAFNTTDDITATSSVSTDYTILFTAWKGGTSTVIPSLSIAAGATGDTAITTSVAGAGSFTEIGACDSDYSVEVDSEEKEDMEGNTMFILDTVTAEFAFANITQRNIDILKTFRGTKVTFCLVDFTDRANPNIYCINDILFNVRIAPAGDMKTAPIKLTKKVRNSLTGTYWWDYQDDLAS